MQVVNMECCFFALEPLPAFRPCDLTCGNPTPNNQGTGSVAVTIWYAMVKYMVPIARIKLGGSRSASDHALVPVGFTDPRLYASTRDHQWTMKPILSLSSDLAIKSGARQKSKFMMVTLRRQILFDNEFLLMQPRSLWALGF